MKGLITRGLLTEGAYNQGEAYNRILRYAAIFTLLTKAFVAYVRAGKKSRSRKRQKREKKFSRQYEFQCRRVIQWQ